MGAPIPSWAVVGAITVVGAPAVWEETSDGNRHLALFLLGRAALGAILDLAGGDQLRRRRDSRRSGRGSWQWHNAKALDNLV